MDDKEVKTDRFGWKYYNQLPGGYRLGTMDDFHVNGNKKVGMEYLIQRGDQQYYEMHIVTEETRSKSLIPFFEWDMIFVKII